MTGSGPTMIGGRYQLAELLGRGGMAEVRKGVDTRLGRAVAVKRLRTDLASDATFQARFRREAQSSASLNHPAIVAVYDTGEELDDATSVAQPYIVMEYVAGRTLRDILREGRKILPERALEITSGVLSALDYSHRAGIIHRDIKPGNVMLTPTGDVKVMDFGIARAISDSSAAMTQTAAVVGTAQYLSPEQARGETVDSRSDVYSTGCLLYELLTGRPPFVGDSPVAVAYQHVREPAVPPSQFDEDLPPELDAITMKALAKRVEDRYQSAAAMRADIERYLAGRPVSAPAVPVAETSFLPTDGAFTADPTPTPAAPLPRVEDRRDSRSGAAVWLLVLLVLAAVAGAALLLPRLMESPPEEVQVPAVVNLSEADARAAIGDAGLSVGFIDRQNSDSVPVDVVISQDPNRDTFVGPGTEVDLVVSLGRASVEVPYVLGQPRAEAGRILAQAGLRPRFEEREADEDRNVVLETDPAPGTSVDERATVTVYYSDGPEQVPSVVGRTEEEATRTLQAAGFQVRVVRSNDTTEPAGTVTDQEPDAGQTWPANATVVIVVSSLEPEPTETASPTATASPTQSPSPNGGGGGGGATVDGDAG